MKQLDFLGATGAPIPAPRVVAPRPPRVVDGDGIARAAAFSPCRLYRWWLSRTWAFSDGPMGLVCMLNPSTANKSQDDPTVRSLIQRAKGWGWSGFYVVNLCSLISPDPSALLAHAAPIGDETDATIHRLAHCAKRSGGALVVAWGGIVDFTKIERGPVLRYRDGAVLKSLRGLADVYCLAMSKGGDPVHPMARGRGRIPVAKALELYASKKAPA